MSLAGLRKQINKANQFMSEKIAGIKGTELDDEYVENERKIDTIGKLVEEVVTRTHEYLQPNPATRARLMTVNTFHKLQGKAKNNMYPQPEGQLGECMLKYGGELGMDSCFGQSLVQSGEAFKELAEIKYSLEDQVKQNFLDPMHSIQTKDLREINHHRKKLEGRRLDYDCKKRKQEKGAKIPDEEVKMAEEKFEETKILTDSAMRNFLSSDVEHIAALAEFIASELEYHRQAADILDRLSKDLNEKRDEAASRPRSEYVPKRVVSSAGDSSSERSDTLPTANNHNANSTNLDDTRKATARALFDFDAENDTELPFKENDMIRLIQQVDENWFEGEVHGRCGYFPVNYVEVVVPLP